MLQVVFIIIGHKKHDISHEQRDKHIHIA